MKYFFLLLLCTLMINNNSQAQLKDILKRKVAEGARQGSENATEKTIDKATDKLLKGRKDKKKEGRDKDSTPGLSQGPGDAALKTYSKYDFIPGEKIMGYDDFSKGDVGDFPGTWNTNASGEIMTVENYPNKWLNISKEGFYLPSFITQLPDNFTIEYDLLFIPLSTRQGPNTASLSFQLINKPGKSDFEFAPDRSYFELDPYMNNVNIGAYTKTGEKLLANQFTVKGLDRNKLITYHVAVWRQKNRLRVYLNETKVVDAPSLLAPGIKYNAVRFSTSLNNDGSSWLISNFKYASGLPDTRNKLMTEGKFSTTGILFDINSATIRASSYGTLKDIATILKENETVKVKIVGHTDGDGDNAVNLELSKKRAEAVKSILAKEFGIDDSRMQTDGMGETKPQASNNTSEGKAHNRRVEFIKVQ